MGKLLGNLVLALVSLSMVLTSITMYVSFQKVSIFLTSVKAGEFEMSLLRFKVDVSADSELCYLFSTLGVNCEPGQWGSTLQHSSRYSVAPFNSIFPNLSTGLANAYAYGMALFIVLATQLCLQLVALWLFYMYLNDAPKAQLRTTGQLVIIIALVSTALATMIYHLMVSYYLVGSEHSQRGFSSPFGQIGFSTVGFLLEGHWLNTVSMIVQVITIFLGCQMEVKGEVVYTDAKSARQFEMEMRQGHRPTNQQVQQDWQAQQHWQAQQNQHRQSQAPPHAAQQWQPSQDPNWQAQDPNWQPQAQQQNWQPSQDYGGHRLSLSQPSPYAGPQPRGSQQYPPPHGGHQQPHGGYDPHGGHRGSYPAPPQTRPSNAGPPGPGPHGAHRGSYPAPPQSRSSNAGPPGPGIVLR